LGFAGVASTAHASLTASTSNPTCSYTNFSGQKTTCASTNLVAANLPADANGFQGVTFYLSGTDTSGFFQNNPGALTDIESSSNTATCTINESCTTTIIFSVSGAVAGTGSLAMGSTIGLLGNFGLGIDTTALGGKGSFSGDGEVPYTLSFDLVDNSTDVFGGPVTLSGANAATNTIFQNAVTGVTINAGDTLTLIDTLTVNWYRMNGSPGLIVSIPQGSLDFDGFESPEPTTFVLFGAALAALIAFRLRKPKQA
jgi:hypothetical protein